MLIRDRLPTKPARPPDFCGQYPILNFVSTFAESGALRSSAKARVECGGAAPVEIPNNGLTVRRPIDSFAVLRIYALPPGTPADRVEILRGAFTNALKDPRLINEAERQGVNISPLGGEQVGEIVRKMAQTPAEVLEQYKILIGKK